MKFGISPYTVRDKVKKLGLNKVTQWTEEDDIVILQNYDYSLSIRDNAKRLANVLSCKTWQSLLYHITKMGL